MKEYVILSLETHLFFGRIMKEHSLFLLAGFPAKETECIRRADWFREEFEDGLKRTVKLTGIPIDVKITEAEERLRAGNCVRVNREIVSRVRMLNRQMLKKLNGLISFKEEILGKVTSCRLYTANYPLLHQQFKTAGTEGITGCQIRSVILPLLADHVLREANHYLRILEYAQKGRGSYGIV